jgi:hypothetical protein
MRSDDVIHPSFKFPYVSLRGVHRARRGSSSLVCSPKDLGEGQGDGNGSNGRGELGCLLSWRAHEGLGAILFVVITLARRRVHHRRGVHS